MSSQRHKCEVHGEVSLLPSIPCPAYESISLIVPGQKPIWVYPIVIPPLTVDQPMDPINLHIFCYGATSFAVTEGVLPPGLNLAGGTGIISGTPTVIGDTTGLAITATKSGIGSTESDLFDISVVA